jgi:hypothetical protein
VAHFTAAESCWWDTTERQLKLLLPLRQQSQLDNVLSAVAGDLNFAQAAAKKYALPYPWKTSLARSSELVEERLLVMVAFASGPPTC